MCNSYLLIDELLNSIVVTDINCVKIDGVVDVGPHVVVMHHMVVESLRRRIKGGPCKVCRVCTIKPTKKSMLTLSMCKEKQFETNSTQC